MPRVSFYQKQQKIALRNVSLIDPGNIDEYIAFGGYIALAKALAMPAKQVIRRSSPRDSGEGRCRLSHRRQVEDLQRGCRRRQVCGGQRERGDPDIGMHRSMMEGDPHSVLEGLIIAAYAVGAAKGSSTCPPTIPRPWPESRRRCARRMTMDCWGKDPRQRLQL